MKPMLFLTLMGCSTAYTAQMPSEDVSQVSVAQQPLVNPPFSGLVSGQPVHVSDIEDNPERTVEVMEAAAVHVQTLSDAQRQPLIDAMSAVVTNCPYTRARVMVLLTVETQLLSMDTSLMSPAAQAQFAQVLRGVQAETSFFRALDADALPMPLPSDYLASSTTTVDGRTFEISPQRAAVSMAALDAVDASVSAMPSATQEYIRAGWDVINPHLGHHVVLSFNERHIRDGLGALLKTEAHDSHPQGLTAVRLLVEELGSHGC